MRELIERASSRRPVTHDERRPMDLLTRAKRKPAPELWVRIAARAIDVLVVGALDLGLGRLMGFGVDWVIAGAAIVLAYFALCDRFAGATLGKLALGLRVVGPEGGRPSLRQALIRESCMVVGAIPFVGPLLAFTAWIWIGVSIRSNPSGQGKHDLLAGGTRVVRKRVQLAGDPIGEVLQVPDRPPSPRGTP